MGCIYKVENKINGNIYIGKTIQPFSKRKYQHLWDARNYHGNMIFHKAIRKYGEDNFEWEILGKSNDEIELCKLEQKYIKFYNSRAHYNGYNQTGGGDGALGLEVTEEKKEKMSKMFTGKDNPFYGRKHTEEAKRKISEANKIKLPERLICERYKNWENTTDLSKEYGVDSETIRKILIDNGIERRKDKEYKRGRQYGKYRGTSLDKRVVQEHKPWKCDIRGFKKKKFLGMFEDPITSQLVYDLVFEELMKVIKNENLASSS